MKQIVVIGERDNKDGSYESANRVYDSKYAAPTIPTASGGGHIPKIIKVIKHGKNTRSHGSWGGNEVG